MNFQEYKTSKKDVYKSFSTLVKQILEKALTDNDFRYQQIQSREKSPDTLQRKLASEELLESNEIESRIKDLAACRIIFYFDNYIQSFLSSDVIKDEFDIEPESYKLFNVTENPRSSNECYTAVSFVIKLKNERTSLREYSEYKGLRCELQITTLLNHAFSETNHDIGYNRPDVDGYGKRTIDFLDQQLKEVMVDHLIPAGYKLQKIHEDYLRFNEGKEYFNNGVENKIIGSNDINELYDSLEKYKNTVIPHYDDYDKEFNEIVKILNITIELSSKFDYKEIETFFGRLPGKTHADILKISLEILNSIRYVNPTGVFQFQIDLYERSVHKDEKLAILNMLENLIEFNLISLRNYDFYLTVCSIVMGWNDDTLRSRKEIVVKTAKALLATEFNSFENDHKSTTIIPHVLKGTEEIKSIRKKCISFLFKLYDLSDSIREKMEIVNCLHNAMRLPRSVENSDELLAIIIENSNQIVSFYYSALENESFDILLCIEDDLFRTYRVSRSVEDRYKDKEEILRLTSLLNQNLLSLKDKLNANRKYTIYKTLVGYNSVFLAEWDDGDFDYHKKTSYRETEIERLADSINDTNKGIWHEIIIMCVNSALNDGATYIYFTKFITLVGQKKPELIYAFLLEKADELQRLLPCFLSSLYFGKLHDLVKNVILDWVNQGKFLQECAQLFVLQNDASPDEEIFIKILDKSIMTDNSDAIVMIIIAFVATYNQSQLHLLQKIFLPALAQLTKSRNTSWINFSSGSVKINHILEQLNESEYNILLDNLIYAKSIDYSVETMLLPICNKFPKMIIQFMSKRINNKSEFGSSFEPIPFNFSRIHEVLSKNLISLEVLCDWYDGNYHDFLHNGAKLVSLIYTDYNDMTNSKLNELLDVHFENNRPKVMAILSHYKGDSSIYEICTKIVSELSENDENLNMMRSIMLGEAGIISTQGTYGMTHYYEGKKKLVIPLCESSNEKISSFAKETIRILDNSIAQANRHGKGDDEMGKIIYG